MARRYDFEITLEEGGRNALTDRINVGLMAVRASLKPGRYEVRITRLREEPRKDFLGTLSCHGCGKGVRVFGESEPEVVRCARCRR